MKVTGKSARSRDKKITITDQTFDLLRAQDMIKSIDVQLNARGVQAIKRQLRLMQLEAKRARPR